MDSQAAGGGGRRGFLAAVLVAAALVRLHQVQTPLLDQMYVKQVYVANKARNIARAPLAPLRDTLDFLDDRGGRMRLAEEIPLYPGLLGACYAAFGEREWIGRLLSVAGTLVAVAAFHGLLRREFAGRVADVGALLLAFAPLMIFYGRAVMPDVWMLACMLLAASAYRRHLDEGRTSDLIAATAAILVGAMFKYYALMVLIPLAEMTWRRGGGWRACLDRRFLAMGGIAVVPVALWVGLVFARTPNPTAKAAYYAFQEPGVLLTRRLYQALLDRFFLRDCGPVAAALALAGFGAALAGRADGRPIRGWAIMGVGFMILLAPKTTSHDYYELMAVPAVAAWGALGWQAVWGAARSPSRRRVGAAVLVAVAVVQSPWIASMKFEQSPIHAIVADRLDRLCTPTGKILVIGQRIGWPVVHYSGREGWVFQDATLRPDWRATFARCKAQGAEYVGLFFDPTVPPDHRATFLPLTAALPVVDHGVGPWFCKGRPCEYFILRLRDEPTPPEVAARSRLAR